MEYFINNSINLLSTVLVEGKIIGHHSYPSVFLDTLFLPSIPFGCPVMFHFSIFYNLLIENNTMSHIFA